MEASPECPVCLERYRKTCRGYPRFLECGHTFCTSCLNHLAAETLTNYFICPLCRAKHMLGSPPCPINPCLRRQLDIEEGKEVEESLGLLPEPTLLPRRHSLRFLVCSCPSEYFIPTRYIMMNNMIMLMGFFDPM